jgi:UDPglucose--hexose-1-phosphate uridylyltransferase
MCSVPEEPATELQNLAKHADSAGSAGDHPSYPDGKPCLLLSYAAEEVARDERVVEVDDSGWVAVVPFWAIWPFEIMRESCLTGHGTRS